MSGPPKEEDDLAAAEFAFGLLDPAEAVAASARIDRDPGFAALCAAWSDRAAALALEAAAPPRASLWGGIVTRLGWGAAGPERARNPWRIATAALALAAAILLAVAIRPLPAPAPAPPPLIAVLTGKDTPAVVAVRIARDGGRLVSVPSALSLPGHVPELWVIAGGAKPRALGVLPADRRGETLAPPALAGTLAPGVTLAVSVEPAGGSPTGQPTGPVILTGVVAES